MTPEEIQSLSVLRAISDNSRLSQRDLSRQTGLNLAKVNYLLRALAGKGHVKLRNASKNPNKLKYLYVLTPHGLMEKSRLTLRFASSKWREYSDTIERLRTSLANLGRCRLLLIGANEVADMLIEATQTIDELEIVGIIDSDQNPKAPDNIEVFQNPGDLIFDKAIPCEYSGAPLADLAAELGIAKEKLWLV